MQISPQQGFQINFLSSEADIVIGGGAAGAGKSFALLLEGVRHIGVEGYGGVIFRRTTPQIKNQGGLRDESEKIYPGIGMQGSHSILEWTFHNGNNIKFSHLEHEKNKYDRQGSQIPFIGFDEVTHFTESQRWYLISRNRSACGVSPYVRATCNPDPDSWVRDLIERWIDENGFIIPERDGIIRYFTRDSGNMVRGDSKQEVKDKAPHLFEGTDNRENLIKSFTFIEGDIYDNKELLEKDPSYLANLMAQDDYEKKKLLFKNWNIGVDDTCIFDYGKIEDIFSNFPKDTEKCITVDVARFGRDLAVIMSGTVNHKKRTDILTKSTTSDIVRCVEERRKEFQIGKSSVLIDQDGIGGGVVDEGDYIGFSGGLPAKEDPDTQIKENYKNLKTQCQYRLANYINSNDLKIEENFYVDGIETTEVIIGKKSYDIKKMIKEDLRSVKRDKIDMDGKKCIIDKKKQKVILKGRSPDCGDTLMQSILFDLEWGIDVLI